MPRFTVTMTETVAYDLVVDADDADAAATAAAEKGDV